MLRAATLTTPDPVQTASVYREWFDYEIVDQGLIDSALAQAWGCPAAADKSYVLMRPRSGAEVYIRFVQGNGHPDYRPLRTYGWAAIEICVQDVLQVNERMLRSPFKIIGPPRPLDGMPLIHPMQVMGPDGEIIYLTQIQGDLPDADLPRAASPIDKLFILVLGCSNLRASLNWFKTRLSLDFSAEIDLTYTMINQAYGLPQEQKHTIATGMSGRDAFLELDQYPQEARPRPGPPDDLPPGIAICTLKHKDLDRIQGPWISEPVRRNGPLYGGGRAGCLRAPDGALVEIVEIV